MRPPELVIFDCDGVLVDTEPIAVRLDVEVLNELGWAVTEEEVVARFLGRSPEVMEQAIEEALGRPLEPGWDAGLRDRYLDALRADLRSVDGIEEALDRIELPTCVASSGSHEKMRFTLGLTGLWPRFEGRIFSATEVPRGKPEPDLFLHAAAAMDADPSACVVVEDSRYGVEAARAAGMRALGYAGGLTPAAWLEGPDTVVFDDMRRLPELLGARS